MALSRITNYIEADGADLNLQSSDTTITADSVLGVINFKAPSEASGTDAILLASKIEAIAEGTFSASSNATTLRFFVAKSAAAGSGTDGAVLKFNSDGNLFIKDLDATDGSSPILTFETGDTDIAQDDVLGTINFQAPDEGTGTDAILVAAGISAVSEGDFSSSSNATKLVFKTASSEAASEKMSLSSAGLLTVSGRIITDDTTEATSTTDGSLQTDGGLSVAKDIVAGDDVKLLSDSAVLSFGADSDITLTHNADTGLVLKNTHTSGNSGIGVILTLQTGDTDIAAGNVLGNIQFQAPDEGTGTDAILVAAAIQAVSEGDFSSSNNATSLQFMTGASEAAIARVKVTSGGNLDLITDGVVLNFGNDGDVDLTHVADKGLTLAVGGQTSSNFGTAHTAADNLVVGGTGNVGISILTDANQNARLNFGDVDDTDNCQINVNNDNQSMTFVVNGSDALTIDNASDFSFPNTAKVEIMETANTGPILAIGTDSNSLSDDAFYGGIDFFAGSSKTVNGRIQGKISGTSENGGHLSFETRLAGGSLTEKMKLFSTGKLFLQTDNIDEIIEVKSTKDGSGTGLIRVIPAASSFTASTRAFVADFINTDHSSAQIGFQLEGNAGVKGSIVSNGNTTASYVTSSDFRLKTDIEDLPDGMSTVKKLRPVKFRWISEGENARYDHGFIAQEAYKVYEKSVFVGGDDPKTEPWQMGNSDLVPIMVKALQESNETIELLTQRCDVLEGTTIEGILLDGTDGSATDAGSKILLG